MLQAEQIKAYNYYRPEEQNKEILSTNNDFLDDAYEFLVKREGYKDSDLNTPEKIYDQFLEHFRYQNVNEVTAIRDLEYAQNANLQEKVQFANLIQLYENMEGDSFNFETIKDYAGGIFTSPSTYAGLLTGGAGKLASTGANQLTKLGIRKLLNREIAKSAGKGAAVEGTIGGIQGGAQELTKVETGLTEEVDTGKVATQVAIQGTFGGLFNAGAGFYQTKKAIDANILLSEAEKASKVVANAANKKSKDFLKSVRADDDIKFLNDSLNQLIPDTYKMTKAGLKRIIKKKPLMRSPLDPDKVKVGRSLAQEKGVDKLDIDFYENLSAAALKVKERIKKNLTKGDRITEGLARSITKGDLKFDELSAILKDHNLTYDQFSLIYLADISDAGRKLGYHGFLKKQIDPEVSKEKVNSLLDSIVKLEQRGLTKVTKGQAKEVIENKRKLGLLKDLDKLRLGLMTSQPATTMRNNANALFRVAVDAGTRSIYNLLKGKSPMDALDVTKYMLNPYEAQVVRKLFENTMPDSASVLFRDAADLSAQSGEGVLAKIGTKANFLNTMSDNFFKQAMFTASLRRRLADDGKDLIQIIKDGKFNTINKETLEGSMQDALEFVYQQSFKGDGFFSKVAKVTIDAHRNVPFVVSSVLPFPRFVANQMKFLYEHTPLLGLMNLEGIGTKQGYLKSIASKNADDYRKMAAKQFMGLMMLTTAYNWRKEQIDDDGKIGTYWYEFKDETGKTVDGRPTYGPFAPYLLASDIILRYLKSSEEGKDVNLSENFLLNPTGLFVDIMDRKDASGKRMSEVFTSPRQYMQDSLQALFGSSFRAGYGIYAIDKLFDDASAEGTFLGEKGAKIMGEFVANLVNTYTIPLSVVKDVYSQYDKFARYVPETRPGGEIDFFKIILNRGTRAMPDIGPNTALGRFFGAKEYDLPLRNPFRSGDVIAINPLEKQMTGFTRMPKLNLLEREMRNLNLQYYDLYRRDPNELVDRLIREELSGEEFSVNLNQRLADVITRDPSYLNLKSNAEKRNYLKRYAKRNVYNSPDEKQLGAREVALNKLDTLADDYDLPYSENDIRNYRKLSKQERDAIDAEFRNLLKEKEFILNGEETADNLLIDSFSILNTRDLDMINPDTDDRINVLQWALTRKGVSETLREKGIMSKRKRKP
jgi:hypothetical protein